MRNCFRSVCFVALAMTITIGLIGCKSKPHSTKISEGIAIKDTSGITIAYYDSTVYVDINGMANYCDSLRSTVDSLQTALFLTNYKIEKVKYYLGIVDRNKTQIKFLKGWIRRAIE